MRIGLLTSIGKTIDAFFPGIVSHWREAGHFVAPAAGTPAKSMKSTTIRGISRRPSPKNILAPMEIAHWAKRNNLDIIVTNTAVASFLSRIRELGTPVVYFCHGLHWNRGDSASERVWQALEGYTLRNTAGVIAINSDDRKWFSARLPTQNIHYSSAGVGVPLAEYPYSAYPTEEYGLRLAWVGELSKRKRPELAVETMRALLNLGVRATLNIYGDGPLNETTNNLVDQYELGDRVQLVGWSPRVNEEISRAHALLHTASWEGLPRVALEALAIGRRMYAFDVKGVRDIPDSSLSPDGDVSRLAEAIAKDWRAGDVKLGRQQRGRLNDSQVAADLGEFLERVSSRQENEGLTN